jgi:xanthine/CO dehydrogenase XdhC/CoxF family maturation factor
VFVVDMPGVLGEGTDKVASELKVLPTLVWKDGDIVYSISGGLTEDYLREVAESMINGK